jgi:hypothetical protein
MVKGSLVIALLCGTMMVAASLPTRQQKQSTQLAVIEGYRTWKLITPKPLLLKPSLDVMCAIAPRALSGGNPHVPKQFLVYGNGLAAPVLAKKGKTYAVGSVIVKEKFAAGIKVDMKHLPKPELLTVMVKGEPGTNPKSGDWRFYVVDGKSDPNKSNELKHCVDCHSTRKMGDWVFGSYQDPLRIQ